MACWYAKGIDSKGETDDAGQNGDTSEGKSLSKQMETQKSVGCKQILRQYI